MSNRPLGAQISLMLKDRGVDVIFGIPGVHNIEMYRGIEEAGIRHILARHEQGAGFMADGYARASGKPGVAYVITGPGLCNIMTPMGQAFSDSVPLLVLSSCLDETAMTRGQLHQMLDQEAAAGCVCDWSETARTAEAAFGLVDRALTEFASARPRPKHISVPIALLGAEAAAALAPKVTASRPGPGPEDVAAAAEWLLGAKRPLFIFGGGARRGARAAQALVASQRAASMCSFAGRGIIPDDMPQAFGPCLSRPGSVAQIEQADLVLVIGSELAEVDLWRPQLGHGAPLIRVDLDPEVLSDPANADLAILADAAVFMEELLALVEAHPKSADGGWDSGSIRKARTAFRAEVDAARPGILPICDALAGALPDNTMIYSDMTQFAYVAKEVWPMRRPGHWHHPYGFGTLGYALPAAIGGAVARPGLPTLAMAGDYGFQYTLQELGVAVELGLPLPILLWDNQKLKEIEDSMVRSQIAPNAVTAQNPDFLALARAFGAGTEQPETLDDMVEAVQSALHTKGPTLILLTPALTA